MTGHNAAPAIEPFAKCGAMCIMTEPKAPANNTKGQYGWSVACTLATAHARLCTW
jgi:hypothetical protein